jgi:L-amino acid N-acyltransferase YncA
MWEENNTIMTEKKITIRIADTEDAVELLKIYRPYVTDTAISFEYKVPTVQEFAGRIENILKKYPYLVAECAGEIIGYAYAAPFKERAAYDWSVETTIYIRMDCRQSGVGRKLYIKLEELLKKQGVLNMNACIAWPEKEDERLTMASIYFHEKLGYQMVGKFHKSGYKFNRWYDMVWMEKLIGAHTDAQLPMQPFSQLSDMVL